MSSLICLLCVIVLMFFHGRSTVIQNFVNDLNFFCFISVLQKCRSVELPAASFMCVLFNDAMSSSYFIPSDIVTISE
jgi:hypothetical protein